MISPIFLCHGGPTLVVEKNDYTDFIKDLGKKLTPKTVVIFTAYWESEITTISSLDNIYDMIYDFCLFTKELYSLKYPAKGSVEVASKLQSMLRNNGIESKLDENRSPV